MKELNEVLTKNKKELDEIENLQLINLNKTIKQLKQKFEDNLNEVTSDNQLLLNNLENEYKYLLNKLQVKDFSYFFRQKNKN